MLVAADAYPACWSSALTRGGGPRRVMLGDVALALTRGLDGAPRAFVDVCPHRGYPLSEGRVVGAGLECAYHGWRFNAAGACVAVPGLGSAAAVPAACLTVHAAIDAHGVTWVSAMPSVEAPRVPELSVDAAPGAMSVRWSLLLEGALEDVAENILDVAHTAFLHRGIFRGPGRGIDIEARARRTAERIEVEYVGEPVPKGVLGSLLAPQGGVVTHVDRFVMPCVAQVEYALGPKLRLLATSFLRREGPARTRAFHVLSLAPRALALVVMPLFAPLAWHVLRQDAKALRAQSENLARRPETKFNSTELDLVGPHVRQMIERAARGAPPLSDAEWRVTMRL